MTDINYLMISGIQHFDFCRRQWALIHNEQQWEENHHTTIGNILHEKIDLVSHERRQDVITYTSLRVNSHELKITGICDVVEFHKSHDGIKIYGHKDNMKVIPVEYKKGKSKKKNSDILQLCAQSICLEEMLLCSIKVGYIYYGESRKRLEVILDKDLKDKTKTMIHEMHSYFDRKYTPIVKKHKGCKECSLKNLCMPEMFNFLSATEYLNKFLYEDDI